MKSRSWTVTRPVDAAPEHVWKVLSDVAAWPEWTPTMTSVDPEPGPLAPGLRVAVKQPGQAAATYVVSEVDPPRSFAWSARKPGLTLAADHVVRPNGHGSEVTLSFSMSGVLSLVLAPVMTKRVRQMLTTEADSLAARCSG